MWQHNINGTGTNMVPMSILVGLGSCLFLCSAQQQQGQQKPECADEILDFHDCIQTNSQPPIRPDFEVIGKDVDACFTKSGCAPPSASQGEPFRNPNGPGRAGPPLGFPPPRSNDTGDSKCFRTVHEKLHHEFANCMKEKDPDFGKFGPPPGNPPPGGFGPPPGGPGGFGPPPNGPPPGGQGSFGQPAGGPGGLEQPPPGGPPPDGPPVEVLIKACNSDQDKAKQLQTCMKDVFDKHKPTKGQVKGHYDSVCKAEGACKSKLGKCDVIIKKKGQATCQCHEQARIKADEIFATEPSCANIQKPPLPGPQNGEKPDCSKPPPSLCEEGFEKFYERFSKSPPPPAPPQST